MSRTEKNKKDMKSTVMLEFGDEGRRVVKGPKEKRRNDDE